MNLVKIFHLSLRLQLGTKIKKNIKRHIYFFSSFAAFPASACFSFLAFFPEPHFAIKKVIFIIFKPFLQQMTQKS